MIYYPADQTEDKSQVVQQTFLISTSSRFVKVQQTLESSNYSRNKVYICLKLDCMFFFCYFIRIFQEHVLCSPLSKMLVPRRVTCLYRQQPWHNTERVRDFCTAHTRLLIYKHEANTVLQSSNLGNVTLHPSSLEREVSTQLKGPLTGVLEVTCRTPGSIL